jgi:hypothetical protein
MTSEVPSVGHVREVGKVFQWETRGEGSVKEKLTKEGHFTTFKQC